MHGTLAVNIVPRLPNICYKWISCSVVLCKCIKTTIYMFRDHLGMFYSRIGFAKKGHNIYKVL